MALDVYVMPLWRFKAGEFTSPIEKHLGLKPEIISLAEPLPARPPWYLRVLEKIGIVEFATLEPEPTPEERRAAAMEEVEALKKEVSEAAGKLIDWEDEGSVHYNQQYHERGMLRAFAAWCDHRDQLPEFIAPPKFDYHQHPVWKLPKPEKRRFPTLVNHSLYTGYFLPVPFEGNYQAEPFKMMDRWECFHDVASTQAILLEISDLLELIKTVPEVCEEEHGSIPVKEACWYAEELQKICTLSLEHKLPVIFYG